MARNTRIRNVGRESINLYPFQILLERNEEVVAEISPEDFLTQFGGTNGSVIDNLSISSTGDSPTVTKAFSGGGGGTIEKVSGKGSSGSRLSWPAAKVCISTGDSGTPGIRYFELPIPGAATVGTAYRMKDGNNDAATYSINITSAGGADIDGSTAAVTIAANKGAISFITDGNEWWTF